MYYAEISDDTRFSGFAFDNGSAPFDESGMVLNAMIASINLDRDALPDAATDWPDPLRGVWSSLSGALLIASAVTLERTHRRGRSRPA